MFASCTVARRTGTTVWFGYSNTLAERRVALVGPGNTVAVNTVAVNGVANRGQTTQFQPGVVERAFAVTVPNGSTATWAVTPQSILGVSDAPSSATSGPSTPACPAGVGVRSATPQIVGGLVPTISSQPVNQLISNGLLVRSSLRFSDQWRRQRLLRWRCSTRAEGAVGLRNSSSASGALVVPAGAPYEALPADRVVRVDSNPRTA